eukprot:scaffold3348_cov113-Isochrysis_galbana.AAC.17
MRRAVGGGGRSRRSRGRGQRASEPLSPSIVRCCRACAGHRAHPVPDWRRRDGTAAAIHTVTTIKSVQSLARVIVQRSCWLWCRVCQRCGHQRLHWAPAAALVIFKDSSRHLRSWRSRALGPRPHRSRRSHGLAFTT